MVDNYVCAYFEINCREQWVNSVDLLGMQVKLVLMSWQYVIIDIIVSWPPCMENGSLGTLQIDTRTQGGGVGGWETSMFRSLSMCRTAW